LSPIEVILRHRIEDSGQDVADFELTGRSTTPAAAAAAVVTICRR
jgi:hypothetical protein